MFSGISAAGHPVQHRGRRLTHVLKNDAASCLDHRCSDRVRRHHPRFSPNAVPDRLLGGHRRSACNPCRCLYVLSPLSALRRTAPNVGSKILSRVWERSGYGPPGPSLTRIHRSQSKKASFPSQARRRCFVVSLTSKRFCCFPTRQTAHCRCPPMGCASPAVFRRAFGPGCTGFAQQRPNAGGAPALTAPEPRIRRSPRARGRPFRARRMADAPADPHHSGAGTAGDRSAPSRAPYPPRRGYPRP